MADMQWYRVIDPLSPLYGADVIGEEMSIVDPKDFSPIPLLRVTGMRRIDMTVGDRPFQLISKGGEDLGIYVKRATLSPSVVQDEVVEIATDRPYGLCVREEQVDRDDGAALHIAVYENAATFAVSDDGRMAYTRTVRGVTEDDIEDLIASFEDGDELDEIITDIVEL